MKATQSSLSPTFSISPMGVTLKYNTQETKRSELIEVFIEEQRSSECEGNKLTWKLHIILANQRRREERMVVTVAEIDIVG